MFTSAHQQTDPREVTRVEVRSKWNLVIIAVFYSNVLFMCGGFLCALNMKQFISGKKKKKEKRVAWRIVGSSWGWNQGLHNTTEIVHMLRWRLGRRSIREAQPWPKELPWRLRRLDIPNYFIGQHGYSQYDDGVSLIQCVGVKPYIDSFFFFLSRW